jgi:hypothetical protein
LRLGVLANVGLHFLGHLLPQRLYVRGRTSEGHQFVEISQGITQATGLPVKSRTRHQRFHQLIEQALPTRVFAEIGLRDSDTGVVNPPVAKGFLRRTDTHKEPTPKHARTSRCVAGGQTSESYHVRRTGRRRPQFPQPRPRHRPPAYSFGGGRYSRRPPDTSGNAQELPYWAFIDGFICVFLQAVASLTEI